jgi:hypothetical protein
MRGNMSAQDGFGVWSADLAVGAEESSDCDGAYGIEDTLYYSLYPKDMIPRQSFNCQDFSGNCNQVYQSYIVAYGAATDEIDLLQNIAHSLGRNLNVQERLRIEAKLGVFNTKVHTLTHEGSSPIRKKPTRKCYASVLDPTKTYSEVIDGCKIQNSCSAITKTIAETGFATWPKVRDLDETELTSTGENSTMNFRITTTGTCASGYKRGVQDQDPTRECYMKYVNGNRVVEQWNEITNPCVPN